MGKRPVYSWDHQLNLMLMSQTVRRWPTALVEHDLDRVRAAADLVRSRQLAVEACIRLARAHGASWNDIGLTLGTTAQGAHQRYRHTEPGPVREQTLSTADSLDLRTPTSTRPAHRAAPPSGERRQSRRTGADAVPLSAAGGPSSSPQGGRTGRPASHHAPLSHSAVPPGPRSTPRPAT